MVDRAIQAETERLTYPAMLPAEIDVWRGWLAKHQGEYERFEYNVRVGPGADPGPNYPQSVRDQAILNTQARIDALAWQGTQATIVEVKDRAGLSAIGQLLGYEVYWKRANPNFPPPKTLLVARGLGHGVDAVLTAKGITYELVTPRKAAASQ